MSFLVSEFLVKHEVTVFPQLLYSPDLAPADLFVFPRSKSTLKGNQYQTTEYTEENSLWDLCAILQNVFQNWKNQWKQCIDRAGEYIEGDKSY
jgi:hypothetical protein